MPLIPQTDAETQQWLLAHTTYRENMKGFLKVSLQEKKKKRVKT